MFDVPTPTRTYGGVSADDRRAERHRRLVEACLDVVHERGVAGTTVDGVCAAAGLTKRYFYAGFADLDALLLTAADEMYAAYLAAMSSAADHEPRRGRRRVRAAVVAVAEALAADPRRARLYAESPGHPGLHARQDQENDVFTRLVLEQVLVPKRDGGPGRAVRARIVVAGATDVLTAVLRGTSSTTLDEAVDAIVELSAAV